MNDEEHAAAYPLHHKLKQMKEEARTAGEFIDFLGEHGYVIAEYDEMTHAKHSNYSSGLWSTRKKPEQIIGEFLGIDSAALSAEKDKMYAALTGAPTTSKEKRMPLYDIINDTTLTNEDILVVASAAHEANRIWCSAHGDDSQPLWTHAPQWQRESAVKGVIGVFHGNTPERAHESWLEEKERTGWVFGEVKDPDKKTHPCIRPYAELDAVQRAKDHIFVGVAQAFIKGFLAKAEG